MSGLSARITTLVFGVGLFLLLLLPRQADAAVHNVSGWAWSGTLGWISMDCNTDPTGCSGPAGDYGLDIDGDGNLSGWAWSGTAGWICFGATCDGAPGVPAGGTPASPAEAADHYCPGFVPCARYDANEQQIHGWAYALSMTDGIFRGWISLNCTDVGSNTASPHSCPSGDYFVEYDEDATASNGEFYGYAWNGNEDETGSGWIHFGCGTPHASCGPPGAWGVTSTFVSTGWTDLQPIEGIYSPAPSAPPNEHLTDIPIVFQDFSAPADALVRCVFRMSDGTYRDVNHTVSARQARAPTYPVSYRVGTGDAVTDADGNPVLWSFSAPPPDAFGCEIQASPPEQKVVSNRVAVHSTSWTFAGPAGAQTLDSLRANYCLEGNTDTNPAKAYFLNTDPEGNLVQCDTEGDLAFTLLKARGIPVEIRCYDNLDDDANLQRDCAGGTPATVPDRNCRGITYLCIPHPPASAPEPPRP